MRPTKHGRARCGLALSLTIVISLISGCEVSRRTVAVLPSWEEGPAKQAIIEFVEKVTDRNDVYYVPPAERIATFDNDGTLWAEHPLYFQLIFAMDRVRALASEHPEWKDRQPFKAVLEDDLTTLLGGGKRALLELIMATHADLTTEEFARMVGEWVESATHPRSGKPFTEMVYQPMMELLAYLRGNDFKTYIVSGGGIEFMRVFSEDVYGIPPEQVIGSSIKTELQFVDGLPVLKRLPEMNFIDDEEWKPVAIHQHIGRRPIAAFGNSDGDLEMLRWVAAGQGPRFCMYVHHTDAVREWAYDRDSPIGGLDKGLDEARARGWTVVDMKEDWNTVFSFDPKLDMSE